MKEHHRSIFYSLPNSDRPQNRPAPVKDQSTLLQVISASQPIPPSSAKWNKLTDSIIYFIVKDMQPLDTIAFVT